MVGFSFGATPAPAAGSGGAPAPSTGGFSFGGATSTSTSTPAAATPSSGGFSFGAAAPAPSASATPAPAPATGGFSFGGGGGGATPAPAPAASSTSAPATSGFSFGAPAAATGASTPAPAPSSTFSFGGTAASTFTSTSTSTSTAPNALATINSNPETSAAATLKIPQYETSFPNLAIHARIESILSTITDAKISPTDLTLHGQELVHILSPHVHGPTLSQPSPIQSKATITAHAQNHNAMRMTMATTPNPTLILPHQDDDDDDDDDHHQPPVPQPIPKRIVEIISFLSSSLDISPQDAGALYGASIVDQINQAYDTLGDDTVQWCKSRKVLPGMANRGFVNRIIEDHELKGTYIGSNSSDDKTSSNDVDMGGSARMSQGENDNNDEIHSAMDLYFLERGQGLETLRVLIQHRISAASACIDDLSSDTNEKNNKNDQEYDGALDLNTIILQATDQLLEHNLIPNLIQLVQDLTVRNEELSKKICQELDEKELRAANPPVAAAPAPTTSAFGGFGGSAGFGASTLAAPVPAVPTMPKWTDGDYAMYQFTFQQRQLACQCLFYLAYHTQFSMEESTGLIDLIRDLTNGENSSNGGVGSGLPVLDPIRDVPDPYTVSWNQDHSMQMNSGMGMGMGVGMAPQQIKKEKRHDQWKQELFSSLWSVRGLSRATVTTSHADFSGQQLYHAMTLKSSTNVGGIDAVGGGKPQLMQSVSSLILAAMCILDGSNILMDRNFHGPNPDGTSNALVPVDNIAGVVQMVKPINDRLVPGTAGFDKWNRQDIAGLLAAAFALLLRPIADVLASPASSSSSSNNSSALKMIFRSCLEAPTVEKSITFARFSLIPCLGFASMTPSSPKLENDFSFFMSVLSDFTAKYLDAVSSFGELPISRHKWKYNEEQELQLRRVQEQQRKQLQELTGTTYNETRLPTEVDVTNRPDCIDDIIALAISICSSCPDCSYRFWSTTTSEEKDGRLVYLLRPSKILKKLEKLQAKDDSLLSIYVSLLGVLSLTNNPNESPDMGGNGADAICEWLSQNNRMTSSPTSYDPSKQVTLEYVLYSIQYYAQQLNPPVESSQSGWTSSANQFQQTSSVYDDDDDDTSYYYGADDAADSYSKSQDRGSNSVTSGSKKKELDERSARILASLLNLLSNVALKSEQSRKRILNIKLGAVGHSRTREDDAITILFSLLVTSITPEIRGLTLSTLAHLIRQCKDYHLFSSDDKEFSDDAVMRCWELLEMSQIVPIAKLGQYSPVQSGNTPSYQANYGRKEPQNWFPPNEEYGILYEMEYVESKLGCYPSTEGLLKLLTALFSSDIQPINLGTSRRPQTGCAPYIEYVTEFVLPRALHVKKREAEMYFATPADKSRLTTRALEVLDAVLTRYVPSIPKTSLETSEPDLVSETFQLARNSPSGSIDREQTLQKESPGRLSTEFLQDEMNTDFSLVHSSIFPKYASVQNGLHSQNDFTIESNDVTGFDSTKSGAPLQTVPRAKSPGYIVLADILSSNGSIVDLITKLLTEGLDNNDDVAINSTALSLFGEFVPDFHTAKTGRDYILDEYRRDSSQLTLNTLDSAFVELFMQPLVYESTEDYSESPITEHDRRVTMKGDIQVWRECTVMLSLRILCAAAARDESFNKCSSSINGSLRIIPVMRFQLREMGLNKPLLIKHVNLTKLSRTLIESSFHSNLNSGYAFFLTILSQYIGYESSSLAHGNSIAMAAMSLMKHILHSTSSKEFVKSIRGFDAKGHETATVSLSTRLSLVPLLKNNENEPLLCDAILSLILRNLEEGSIGNDNLAHVLLGLTGNTLEQQRHYLTKSLQGLDIDLCRYRNVLDAILDLLSDVDFILDPKTSFLASKCFEIIYRLCDGRAQNSEDSSWTITKLCLMNKLRKADFWQFQLLRFLGSNPTTSSILRMLMAQSPIFSPSFNEIDDLSLIKRDSSVLHCISWLIKGLSLELHSLMGAVEVSNSNFIGKFPTSSPQPQQCRRLLHILLGENSRVLMNTLIDLPLTKPLHFLNELLVKKPPNDAIALSSCRLEEPDDVSSGFTAIDAGKLRRALGNLEQDEYCISAIKWAEAWNCYVQFTCSSSHLTKSWSFLTSTIYSSCKELLLEDQGRSGDLIHGGSDSIVILKTILSSLCGVGDDRNSIDVLSNCLDKGALFALSSSIISIADTMFDQHDMHNSHIGEEHLPMIIMLLVEGIAKCENQEEIRDGLQDEIAAIFASMLSAILESNLVQNNKIGLSLSSQMSFRNRAIDTSRFLTSLSCRDLSVDNSPALLSVTAAARSGLSSLLKWFDDLEGIPDNDETFIFLFDLFATETSECPLLSQLVNLVSTRDNDAPNLLQSIASCHGGTELLIQAGITEALHAASSRYLLETNARSRSRYGYSDLKDTQYLYGHASLLCTMLASDVPEHCLQRLLSGTSRIFVAYQGTIETLLTTFPEEEDLLLELTIMLALISDGTKSMSTAHSLDQMFEASVLANFDALLEQFAFHVCQYPYPNKFLPILPSTLREFIPTQGNASDRSWWDNIRNVPGSMSDLDAIILRNPPMQSYSDARYNMNQGSWNLHGYKKACSGMECVDICLTYIMNRVGITSESLKVDGVSLALALHRSLETSQAIASRLRSMRTSVEDNITGMMGLTTLWGGSSDEATKLQAIKHVEETFLQRLGSSLASCVIKLLYVTKATVENITLSLRSGSLVQSYESIKASSKCLQAVLNNAQIETQGIGCLDELQDYESLRQFSKEVTLNLKTSLSEIIR